MTTKHDLHSLYGLKWNPFLQSIPTEATSRNQTLDDFYYRVEHLVLDGGFAMLTGDPGTGKSVALRQLEAQLSAIPEVKAAQYTRPQNNVCDFYRELGALFGVEMSLTNRYRGFKGLRDCWLEHNKAVMFKPVLLIDEAQDVPSTVLSELRLLTSMDFDSKNLLAVVLCGDRRLPERFRHPDLVPLGSRIRTRHMIEPMTQGELKSLLLKSVELAGGEHFITDKLADILAEQAMGNIRAMMVMAGELLAEAVREKHDMLTEELFLSYYKQLSGKGRKRKSGARNG